MSNLNTFRTKPSNGYDAMPVRRNGNEDGGHRIAKHSLSRFFGIYSYDFNDLLYSTYYILDAQEEKAALLKTTNRRVNAVVWRYVMSTYNRVIDDVTPAVLFHQKEKYIYGSSRLGVYNDSIPLYGSQNATYSQTYWTHTIGKRNYELSNHLGNVLSVISDKPIPHDEDTDGVPDWYLADIRQSTDYSAFGVQLSGRNFVKSGAREYRRGYQGSEEDDEVKGDGNSYTTEYRFLDPRLGRWLTIDPMTGNFPWQSPYCSMDNNPICLTDIFGLSAGPGDPPSAAPTGSGQKSGNWESFKTKDGHYDWAVQGGTANEVEITPTSRAEARIRETIAGINYASNKLYSTIGNTAARHRVSSQTKNNVYMAGFDFVNGGGSKMGGYQSDEFRAKCEQLDKLVLGMFAEIPLLLGGGELGVAVAPFVTTGVVTTGLTLCKTGKFIVKGVTTAYDCFDQLIGNKIDYEGATYNYLGQSMSTGGFGIENKDLISFGISGSSVNNILPTWTRSVIGASGGMMQYTINDGFQMFNGSSTYIILSMINGAVQPYHGGGKYGSNFSSSFQHGLIQTGINIYEKRDKWRK